ncbi:hypothetical protein B4096_0584 [Heyndrickxia coagulans]|nr:hypothetical protein B4100_0643 [Heyndrickxia coagulans]KYC85610.1 hypothetical protein B4096_0584 [Heyndrickxia coagulans]
MKYPFIALPFHLGSMPFKKKTGLPRRWGFRYLEKREWPRSE